VIDSKSRTSWNNRLVQQPIREPNQQPCTAWKYRKRPGGDAGPEITNGLGAFLCAMRFKLGFGRAFSFGATALFARVAALAHRAALARLELERHGV
jgi:hypothetical protein